MTFAAAFSAASWEREAELFRVVSPRARALGGYHAAMADDFYTMFSNPAGFRSVERTINLARIGGHASGQGFRLLEHALDEDLDAEAVFGDDGAAEDLLGGHAALEVTGPLAFGYAGNGAGFGLFNSTGAVVAADAVGATELVVREHLVMRGGYAFRLAGARESLPTVDAGLTLNAFVLGEGRDTVQPLDVPDLIDDPFQTVQGDLPFALRTGVGLSVGLLVDWGGDFAVGITADNVYAPRFGFEYESLGAFMNGDGDGEEYTDLDLAPLDLSFGVAGDVPIGPLAPYIDGVRLFLDYRDALDFVVLDHADHPLLKLSLGSEVTVLDIVDLRFGLGRGLPAVGVGLDLEFLSVNGAVYGAELSSQPGGNPVYNVAFGIDVTL